MIIKTILLFLLVVGRCLADAEPSFQLPGAKVTVRVADQNGQVVPDATLAVAGTITASPDSYKKGVSDPSGIFEAEFKCKGEISVTAEKAGWYRSEYWKAYSYLAEHGTLEKALAAKRWEPWNPIIGITLKSIIRPGAMYARSVEAKIPIEAAEIGF